MGKSLGDLEQRILFSLISRGEDAYGASARRGIVGGTGTEVGAGAGGFCIHHRLYSRVRRGYA